MDFTKSFSPEFVVTVENLLGKPYPLKELLKILDTLESQLKILGYSTLRNTTQSAILVRRGTK